ncbi:MAG: hypothetical protein TECD_00818 [Hyphomicrobiaceae bacterium hypho_1]
MIKKPYLTIFATLAVVFCASHLQRHALALEPDSGNQIKGILKPERAPANYWIIKFLSKRAIGCLCANKYPVGMNAGENSEITYRTINNNLGQAISVYALCIKRNKGWNKRILGGITLPLTNSANVTIDTPKDDRNNADAAVLREYLRGAVVIPFRRQGYSVTRCPTNRKDYEGLNWSQPELWPTM